MGLIARIVDFFLERSQRKYRRITEMALEEFRKNICVPYQVDFPKDAYWVNVWVDHEHLQEIIDACRPASFYLEGKEVRDDCSQWSLIFKPSESIHIHCSWLVAYAEPEGIPVGYRRVEESNTWIFESI